MDIAELRAGHPAHHAKATALRVLALDAVKAANSGHSGMPMGMADVATVLFEKHLKFSAADPHWPDRDRFVLSAGHGSMLLYGLLHLTGYADMTMEEIRNFRQVGSKTAGHPEFGHASGIETTTGPLGQGVANAVGMAMAEASLAARFGPRIMDHYTYCIAGDGCLMEGISHEAIGLAGKQRLSKLILIWDNNGITIDGKVAIADVTDQVMRFKAAGWSVYECDGHDPAAIDAALTAAKADPLPSMIAAKSHIAIGSTAQDTSKGHGALTDDALIADAREVYGWPHPPFEIPEDVLKPWREIGARGAAAKAGWDARIAKLSDARQREFQRVFAGDVPTKLSAEIKRFKKSVSETKPKVATRKSSQNVLEVINKVLPETIGGSADLTGSNNTLTGDLGSFNADNRNGRHVSYGVREHGMAGVMNGMALHGGVLPYGGTFLVFSDYARPAMRLAALMGQRVVYVMTHDSIGLGEDGPTHQPVEQIVTLRTMPNMLVLRPCDSVETAEAWELAVNRKDGPTTLALTRQGLPTLRTTHANKNLSAQGGYVLAEAEGGRAKALLMATGSEVEIAMAARAALQAKGVPTRVVSMPSWELFEAQSDSYRRRVLPAGPVRVAIEAGIRMGWDRWLYGERGKREKGAFVGMHGFGASGPYQDLYTHFGITAEAVVEKVEDMLG